MAGRKAFCTRCKGWGKTYVQTVEMWGNGRISRRSAIEERPCPPCGGTGHPKASARTGTPPVMARATRKVDPDLSASTVEREAPAAPVVPAVVVADEGVGRGV